MNGALVGIIPVRIVEYKTNDSWFWRSQMSQTQRHYAVPYPAVLASSVDLHVAAVVRILQQAVVLKEQPGALAQALALVLVVLLDELLHQLEQTLGVSGIPLHQVLKQTPQDRHRGIYTTRSITMAKIF